MIAGSSSATALAMSTVLPLLALLTEMPTEASPLVRVIGGERRRRDLDGGDVAERDRLPASAAAEPPAAAAIASAVAGDG